MEEMTRNEVNKIWENLTLAETLINSALRLHASALSSRRRQILSVACYASGLSPREIQRIHANPEHLI